MNILDSVSPYVAPLLVFGLVVCVHELGHFVAAKMMGVYAPVFSLGWGRRLFGFRRGETDYRVSLIPLGGYVRMATREDDSMAGIEGGAERGAMSPLQGSDSLDTMAANVPANTKAELWDPNAMAPFGPKPVPPDRWVENKSVPARIFILSAGVLMNILLTVVVASGIFYKYGNVMRPDVLPAVIDSVKVGSAAASAGIMPGDRIVSIDGKAIAGWDQVTSTVKASTQGSLQLELDRAGQRVQATVTPTILDVQNPSTGAMEKQRLIGVIVRDSIVRESVGLLSAIQHGGRATWGMATNVTGVLRGLVTGAVSTSNLGGPIAIARTSVQAARDGAETLWSLIAFLSLNIAILNLVPIPVLDGGQILLVLAEAAKGKAFSGRTREAFARVGVLAVLALVILVTFNDVRAWFTR
ncbi:MAG: RIP metalloprotease RseP [Gemmatimonas sp.]